jgi:transketolase
VLDAARETEAVITIEEHSVVGGLGSAVAERLAETDGTHARFRRIGVPAQFSPRIGSQEYMLAENGIDVDGIRRTLGELLGGSTGT